MLNICFDGRVLKNGLVQDSGRTGIYFVARNIFQELHKRNKQLNLYLFLDDDDMDILDKLGQSLRVRISKNKILTASGDFSKIDAFLSPIFKIPEQVKKYPNVSCYTVVYDLMPFLFPDYFTGAHTQTWFDLLIDSINNEDYYFSISDYTKKDFLKFLPQLNPYQIDTVPLSTNFPYKPVNSKKTLSAIKQRYNIPADKKYLFSLCSLEPRKNLIRAVKSFVRFIEKNKIDDLVFVLGGGAWSNFIEKLEHEVPDYQKYADKIIRAGYVADEDLGALYSGAEWFVYTSQYEGFGMPPLEAMSCGTAVITSNNSSLPEVVGNAAITIDYDSEEQHIAAYEQYYYDEKLRKKNASAGLKRAKQFSWKKCVDVIIDKMQKVEKKKSNMPLVSVITPTFNLVRGGRVESFAQNIKSVQAQTYKNIEHIVMDGASKDGTDKLLTKYQKSGAIKYYSKPDKGIYDGMNNGILKAKGKYVVCLNSDDFYCDKRAIETLVRKAEELDADACFGNAVRVNPNTMQVVRKWVGRETCMPWINAWPCHQTFLIKTKVMNELGLYDLKYKVSADNNFFMRMLNAGKKIVGIDLDIIYFREGGFSDDNLDTATNDQITGLYTEYGQYHGLTMLDCSHLWGNRYLTIPISDAIALGNKLDNAEWRNKYFKCLMTQHVNAMAQDVLNAGAFTGDKKYYLFDFIPFIKTKFRYGIKRYLLFNFLPILKIKYLPQSVQMYLFGFIPLVFRRDTKHAEYALVKCGTYDFAQNLPFLVDGCYGFEPWGVWSNGKKTSMFIKTDDKYVAEFDVVPFLCDAKPTQVVYLRVNGRKHKYVFKMGKPLPKVVVKLPRSNHLKIEFNFKDIRSPKDLGLSDDTRKLAVGFKKLILTKR